MHGIIRVRIPGTAIFVNPLILRTFATPRPVDELGNRPKVTPPFTRRFHCSEAPPVRGGV